MSRRPAHVYHLKRFARFRIEPVPPFSFELTVRNPAGWELFTSDEVYERGTLWTGIRYEGKPAGLKIESLGTTNRPHVQVSVYTARQLNSQAKNRISDLVAQSLGAEQDLREFYEFARRDPLLKHVVEDLYGMHDTQTVSLYNSVILSICLQMARLKRSNEMMEAINRKYGETIEFDGRQVLLQPAAEKIAKLDPKLFAKRVQVGIPGQVSRGLGEDDCRRIPRNPRDNRDATETRPGRS